MDSRYCETFAGTCVGQRMKRTMANVATTYVYDAFGYIAAVYAIEVRRVRDAVIHAILARL